MLVDNLNFKNSQLDYYVIRALLSNAFCQLRLPRNRIKKLHSKFNAFLFDILQKYKYPSRSTWNIAHIIFIFPLQFFVSARFVCRHFWFLFRFHFGPCSVLSNLTWVAVHAIEMLTCLWILEKLSIGHQVLCAYSSRRLLLPFFLFLVIYFSISVN